MAIIIIIIIIIIIFYFILSENVLLGKDSVYIKFFGIN